MFQACPYQQSWPDSSINTIEYINTPGRNQRQWDSDTSKTNTRADSSINANNSGIKSRSFNTPDLILASTLTPGRYCWINVDGTVVLFFPATNTHPRAPLPLRGYYFDERPSCKTTAKFFFIYVAARNLSFGHFCWAVLEKQLF